MNYYIEHISEIIAICDKENVTFDIGVVMFDDIHGVPEYVEELRSEFYAYIRGKAFSENGKTYTVVGDTEEVVHTVIDDFIEIEDVEE